MQVYLQGSCLQFFCIYFILYDRCEYEEEAISFKCSTCQKDNCIPCKVCYLTKWVSFLDYLLVRERELILFILIFSLGNSFRYLRRLQKEYPAKWKRQAVLGCCRKAYWRRPGYEVSKMSNSGSENSGLWLAAMHSLPYWNMLGNQRTTLGAQWARGYIRGMQMWRRK